MKAKSRRADPQPGHDALKTRHRRYGWTALLLWMLVGVVLESLHGLKLSAYLLDPLRREFWTLAHFHGSMLALLNLVYVSWTEVNGATTTVRRRASTALIAGSVLMPLGFFVGGAKLFGGDPSPGIVLVPVGALALLYTVFVQVRAAWN